MKNRALLTASVLILFSISIATASSAPAIEKLYWGDNADGKIRSADLDGSNIKEIITGNNIRGLEIDIIEEKIYWTDVYLHLNSKIQRADLDGANSELLYGNAHIPNGIALDLVNKKVYWVDYGGGTDRIQRSNLNGSEREIILTGATAYDIAIDPIGEKIYWTSVQAGQVGNRTIRRADLNGASAEIIVYNLGTPDGITLDRANGRMYWTDQSSKKVQRAKLDGSDIEDLVDEGLDRPFGIALDLLNKKMYWADWGARKIQRSNLNGSSVEDLITEDLLSPLYIALTTNIDSDNDGVIDMQDKCPKTGKEIAGHLGLRNNRFADIDNDGIFETAQRRIVSDSEYDLYSTKGCTCGQILESLQGSHMEQLRFGCTKRTMKKWIS